ncbi:hypothetical protein [Alteriqipengyuania lutimaris]|uniref:DUF4175 domain-containing protein n=1 Tax=Alteriqipengyuania lutimaris TaxID=1538146 RepID=A0A395LHI7_9SPHN|nr:hypothetical protein [Alteriqipengyuania lutimaris]MBB3034876.1 hypothetical protein [Alteriqipengyuania lutimaris]RDS76292.1 hypothetical protein DL238_00780 [Alteriqipengyuania lutimaris]
MSARRPHSNLAIFAWPILIGAASLLGLVVGLTGEGARDIAAWSLLGSTLVAIAISWRRATRPAPSPKSKPIPSKRKNPA